MAKEKQKREHVAWGTQPTYSIAQTAYFLNTGPANVTSLLKLGLIKGIKLKSMSIPQFEIERFLKDNLGNDLAETIKAEQERQFLEKQGRELITNV